MSSKYYAAESMYDLSTTNVLDPRIVDESRNKANASNIYGDTRFSLNIGKLLCANGHQVVQVPADFIKQIVQALVALSCQSIATIINKEIRNFTWKSPQFEGKNRGPGPIFPL